MNRLLVLTLVAASLLWIAGVAVADTVYIGTLARENVVITRVESGQLYFIAAGREQAIPLERVTRIQVEGEAAFNASEDAHAAQKWDDAIAGYQRVVRGTNKEWLRDWSTSRLLDSANRAGRFDAAVTAFIAMAQKDLPAALKARPALPAARSTFLDSAATELTAASNNARLTDEQRVALLTLLVDVQTLRNDTRAVEAASARLDEIVAKDPSRPEAQQLLARRKLQTAQQALSAKDYQKVLTEIEAVRTVLSEAPQQAEALYLIAEARFGMANRTDATAMKDAGLAFMRVVAHFSNTPGRPFVAQSLLRTAEIHELLNEKPVAARLYEQVVAQFTDDAQAVARARASLQKLKGE